MNLTGTLHPNTTAERCADDRRQVSPPRRYIRIVRVPPGEAPLWVREKWIGLELPLAGHDRGTRHAYTSGVLSGPHNRFVALFWALRGRLQQSAGYAVEASEALEVLERKAPDAAAWWRENVPRVSDQGRKLLFPDSICEVVYTWPAA